MSDMSPRLSGEEGTSGYLNYMDATARPSLYRNGRVLTRRDPDGSDAGTEGVNREKQEMAIHNARILKAGDRRTIRANGFELLTRPLASGSIDFFDHEQVVRKYYGACAEIVREFTGAQAFAFDHNVRSASGKKTKQRIAGGQQVQGPAHLVHGDYTLTSAPQRLRDLAEPPTGNDTVRSILGEGRSLINPEIAEQVLEEGG